eukprot:TRINITY_DN760_c0_g1_i1.p1 TRINITY_DN760_c0_g1~~TRINITY_DN760_c0_g1_i1.p1  ORF type:complete len:346 (+),score=56.12 TRINITY_DN760_c0_g1_i1:198-1235(+)
MDVLAPMGLSAATPDEKPSLAFLMNPTDQEYTSTLDASARKALDFDDDRPPSSTMTLTTSVATNLNINPAAQEPALFSSEPAAESAPEAASDAKPPVSYAKLAALAIAGHPKEMASVADIYKWVMDRYPYFRSGKPWWKNCIRHNLSMKKCFVRQPHPDGNGSVWTLHPDHRQEILHASSPRNLSRKRRRPSAPAKLATAKDKKSNSPPAPKVSPVVVQPTSVSSLRRHSIASSSPVPAAVAAHDIIDVDIGDLLLSADALPDPFVSVSHGDSSHLHDVFRTNSSMGPSAGLDALASIWSPPPPPGQSLGAQLMMETLDDHLPASPIKMHAGMEVHAEPDLFNYM